MRNQKIVAALVAASASLFAAGVTAQESAATPGTVWELSSIQVEPGQFERYLDYLAGNWRRINELGRKEGTVVSYHVFQVNDPRNGEPDLILAVEYKDYMPNAERLALQKKIEAMLATDAHKMDSAAGERKVMRKVISNMELQELKLK